MSKDDDIIAIEHEQQVAMYISAHYACIAREAIEPHPKNGTYCPMVWDDIMCWPDVPNGTIAVQKCPNYVHGFKMTGFAERECLESGSWFVHPALNKTWTNYSKCMSGSVQPLPGSLLDPEIFAHIERIKIIYNTGYGISLLSLLIAVVIMLFFRKLHCPRNIIHLNLFVSFMLRAILAFVRDSLIVLGIGLAKDVTYDESGNINFIRDNTQWECRVLTTCVNYVICANYVWILLEGVYLNRLMYMAFMPGDNRRIFWSSVIGWLLPTTFVVPWVVVRAMFENILCWTTHREDGYFWIIKGPIATIVVVNFLLFLNIVRILFTKLKASHQGRNSQYRKYLKLAKSTLVLLPLFGVHFVVFLAIPDHASERVELVKNYLEMLFTSFQGFFVAVLFCFLNGEVQTELRKFWNIKCRRTISESMVTNLSNFSPSAAGSSSRNNSMTSYENPARSLIRKKRSSDERNAETVVDLNANKEHPKKIKKKAEEKIEMRKGPQMSTSSLPPRVGKLGGECAMLTSLNECDEMNNVELLPETTFNGEPLLLSSSDNSDGSVTLEGNNCHFQKNRDRT